MVNKQVIDIMAIDQSDYWIEGLKGFNLFVVDKDTDKLTAKVMWLNCKDHLKSKIGIIVGLANYLEEYRNHNRFTDIEGLSYWDYKIAVEAKYHFSDVDKVHLQTSYTILDCESEEYDVLIERLRNKAEILSKRLKYEHKRVNTSDLTKLFTAIRRYHQLDDNQEYIVVSRYGLSTLNKLLNASLSYLNKKFGETYDTTSGLIVETPITHKYDVLQRFTLALPLQDANVVEITNHVKTTQIEEHFIWENITFVWLLPTTLLTLCEEDPLIESYIGKWVKPRPDVSY